MTQESDTPDAEGGEKVVDPPRPTPVRQAMEAGESDESAEKPPRVIEVPESGEKWIVAVTGRSGSGILPLRSIPLADLTFARPQTPEQPERQVLIHDRALDDVTDAELISLLNRSKSYTPPLREPDGKKGRGRKRARHRRSSRFGS